MKQNEIATTKSNSAIMSGGYEENRKKNGDIFMIADEMLAKLWRKIEELNTWQNFFFICATLKTNR